MPEPVYDHRHTIKENRGLRNTDDSLEFRFSFLNANFCSEKPEGIKITSLAELSKIKYLDIKMSINGRL